MSPKALCRSFLAAGLFTFVLATPALGAPYSWGSATSGDWSVPANWTPAGGPPGSDPADTATIAATGGAYTVTLNQSRTISGFTLNSDDATLSSTGRSLTVNGTAQLTQGQILWTGASWGGTGTLINSTDFTVQSTCSISAGFTQNGDLVLRTHSVGSPAYLTVSNGFTSAGTIELTSSASANTSLNVTTGALTNDASGLIDFQAGAGGTRYLYANLTNNGQVSVGAETKLTKSSGQYTNNGTFTIAGSKTLTMTSSNQQFTQAAGTLTIDGAFDISTATFNYDGGTITGTPVLTSSTLNVGLGGTAPATFRMHKGCTLSGDLSAGQVITADTNSVGAPATLTAANGFTNAGTIELTSSASANTSLNVTTGALTNAAGGLIDFQTGAGGTRNLNANLTNNGQVTVGAETKLTKSSGQYTNNGTFTIAGSKTLTMTSSNQQFTQADGTLTIDGAFNISSATFNYDGGTITGTPVLTYSTLNVGPGGTAPATFRMHGACSLSGDLSAGQVITADTNSVGAPATLTAANGFTSAGTFNYDGGTIIGTPVLTYSNLNIGPGGTAPATFRMHGACSLTGDPSAGQVITADTNSVGAPATLTAANGFTSAGTIELTSGVAANTYLSVTSGTLTNAAGGLIDSLEGMGGRRYIGAHLDNNGLIRIDAATFFNKSSGQYANAGTIRLFDNTATFTGSSLTNDVAGLIAGTGTLTASSLTFINHGTVAPGLSAGILEFVGTYDQSETGLLEFEIGGYTVGDEYDRLAVTGAAALDGLVDVDLINPFIPDPGDRFDVLTATGGITDNGLVLAPEDVGAWLLIPPAGGTVLQVEYVPEPGTLLPLAAGRREVDPSHLEIARALDMHHACLRIHLRPFKAQQRCTAFYDAVGKGVNLPSLLPPVPMSVDHPGAHAQGAGSSGSLGRPTEDIDLENGVGQRTHPQHRHLRLRQMGCRIPLRAVIAELFGGHILRGEPLRQARVVALVDEAAAVNGNDESESRVDSRHGAHDRSAPGNARQADLPAVD